MAVQVRLDARRGHQVEAANNPSGAGLMELEFFGAAGEVTGSCHILRANGRQILLDCGMTQENRGHPQIPQNRGHPQIPPSSPLYFHA